MKNKNDFLEGLAQLCEEYDAEFSYTTDDDGIHITLGDRVDGDEVFVGHMICGDVASSLRAAKHEMPAEVVEEELEDQKGDEDGKS